MIKIDQNILKYIDKTRILEDNLQHIIIYYIKIKIWREYNE